MGIGGYVKPERIWLKNHPELNEKWVQGLISDDPSILGLGNLVLRDTERKQPGAGRLDLLLQDTDSDRRYEVEIQLGATDESHIIRTIEYWDIERKRYPQYDHCAVLVAEDVTSRFLNVISLFNGAIPLIAIQFQALKIGAYTSLVFTTVMNELTRGPVDEDEEREPPADRAYWEQHGSKATVSLADQLLEMMRELDPGLELSYNKSYISLSKNGRVNSLSRFSPRKNHLRLVVFLEQSKEVEQPLDEAGLDFEYRRSAYRLQLSKDDVQNHGDVLKKLMSSAYERRTL
ncbi:MAG: hypothetical protein OXG62_04640 [Nitrospinae bacterium]|nr:hypothetical protein [Nitrospinota bacterium]